MFYLIPFIWLLGRCKNSHACISLYAIMEKSSSVFTSNLCCFFWIRGNVKDLNYFFDTNILHIAISVCFPVWYMDTQEEEEAEISERNPFAECMSSLIRSLQSPVTALSWPSPWYAVSWWFSDTWHTFPKVLGSLVFTISTFPPICWFDENRVKTPPSFCCRRVGRMRGDISKSLCWWEEVINGRVICVS